MHFVSVSQLISKSCNANVCMSVDVVEELVKFVKFGGIVITVADVIK